MGSVQGKHVEQIAVPVVCFAAIVLMHMRYLKTWLQPSVWADPHAVVDIGDVHNLRTFFVGIRTRWVLENHGRTQVAVQTLRDMISVTTAIGSASMAFISIFIGLSKTSLVSFDLISCDPRDGSNPCNTSTERLKFARFALCIANFVGVFYNMLLATRYAMNSSFMLNTKEVDGKPLSQMLTVNVLARASFHYTLGIRGFFLAAPLVAWLFGSYMLLGTTVFYLAGMYLMEEDFLLTEEVWKPLPAPLSEAALARLDGQNDYRDSHNNKKNKKNKGPVGTRERGKGWRLLPWRRGNARGGGDSGGAAAAAGQGASERVLPHDWSAVTVEAGKGRWRQQQQQPQQQEEEGDAEKGLAAAAVEMTTGQLRSGGRKQPHRASAEKDEDGFVRPKK